LPHEGHEILPFPPLIIDKAKEYGDLLDGLADELADVVICVDRIAAKLNLDLGECVRRKFNATSAKNDLKTIMPWEGNPT
jgi:NTP pyrophosphatase (non-canonical NTP hydrolase)